MKRDVDNYNIATHPVLIIRTIVSYHNYTVKSLGPSTYRITKISSGDTNRPNLIQASLSILEETSFVLS